MTQEELNAGQNCPLKKENSRGIEFLPKKRFFNG